MKQTNPLVSVLMTAYNREMYIAEAIESVLASTFKDFELIIVDDCSSDKTVEIAKKYEILDSRVKVYINEKNLGDYPNRNMAASLAKGKYIKYLDADDLIYPWGLDIVVQTLETFPNASYCLDSIEPDKNRIFPFVLSPHEAYYREYFVSSIFSKAPTSSTIKLEVFNRFGKFSGKQHVGDYEMWHKLSLTENVVLLPHGIVWSREHDAQESFANRNDSFVLFKYMIVSVAFLKSENVPLSNTQKEILLNRLYKSLSRSVIRSIIYECDLAKANKKVNLMNFSIFKILYYAFRNF